MPKFPGISHKRAVKAFEKASYWVVRQGKYISMTNGERIIIIPRANPVNAYTMGGIIRDSGLTFEEFKKLIWLWRPVQLSHHEKNYFNRIIFFA